MLLSFAVLLLFSAHSYGGGTFNSNSPQTYNRLGTSDFITIKNIKRQDYQIRKPYRLAPIPRIIQSLSKRRSSRKNDATFDRTQDRDRDLRISSPGRYDEVLLRQVPRQSARRPYIATIRRNDKAGSQNITPGPYGQTVPSFNGPVAIPASTSQDVVNKTPNQLSAADIQSADKIAQLDSRPSKISVPDTRSSFDTLIDSNPSKTFLFSPPGNLPGVVYQVKPDPLIPSSTVLLTSDPQPYDFGYGIDDGLGSSQFRRESSTGDGVVTGNYGFKDFQGIFRHVNYVADKDGFRAVMRTNEPSVLPVDSADVSVIVDPPSSIFVPVEDGSL